jgi:hypothetical protein
MPDLSRRDLFHSGAAVGMAAAGATAHLASGIPAAFAVTQPRRRETIREENAKAGTVSWILSNTRVDPKTQYRCPWVEGYCSRTSVRAGETIDIMVSTNPPSSFVIDVYRLGYYGGKGGRQVAKLGPFAGKVQPDPDVGPERLRECRWEPSTKLTIPADWPSGVYLGKLTEQKEKLQSYVIFIVRDDRPCDFLFQCSDTTWAAYNRWPHLWSLYDEGTPPHSWYSGPGVRVSWDRPYGKYRQIFDAPMSQGSGEFLLWEFPLAFWMEKQGYDVSYISNADTHADGKGLRRGKAFLSVGHDEYWSMEMFDNVKAAIAGGVNAAFLSGNSVCWVLDMGKSRAGVPNRTFARSGLFGWDDARSPHDPDPRMLKLGARWTKHGPKANTLMGAQTTFPANGGADWICKREKHWLFAGTGMKNGDRIPGLVGWEHHGVPGDIPGLEVLAEGPVYSRGKAQGVDYAATIYPGPKKNFVFNAATIWWSDGLAAPPAYLRPSAHDSAPPGPDPRVQRMTTNLFARFIG